VQQRDLVEYEKGFKVPSKWICPPFFKLFSIAAVQDLCYSSHGSIIKGSWKREKKREGFSYYCCPPSFIFNKVTSVPSAGSGAATTIPKAKKHVVLARQQAQESNYPLWKYVTRHQGPGSKLKRGGNIL
jgi:hypothetical protein